MVDCLSWLESDGVKVKYSPADGSTQDAKTHSTLETNITYMIHSWGLEKRETNAWMRSLLSLMVLMLRHVKAVGIRERAPDDASAQVPCMRLAVITSHTASQHTISRYTKAFIWMIYVLYIKYIHL